MTLVQILARLGTLVSLILAAWQAGGPVNWENLIVQLLQAIFNGIPASTMLALKAWLAQEANAAAAGIWNAVVAWSKVRPPTPGVVYPDYWVEIPAPGFPVPGPTNPGDQPGP